MSSSTVEIEGYGEVAIRPLTRGQMELIAAEAGGDEQVQLAEIVRRGCVRPNLLTMSDEEFVAEFRDRPNVLPAIGAEIMDRSWPAVED